MHKPTVWIHIEPFGLQQTLRIHTIRVISFNDGHVGWEEDEEEGEREKNWSNGK